MIKGVIIKNKAVLTNPIQKNKMFRISSIWKCQATEKKVCPKEKAFEREIKRDYQSQIWWNWQTSIDRWNQRNELVPSKSLNDRNDQNDQEDRKDREERIERIRM